MTNPKPKYPLTPADIADLIGIYVPKDGPDLFALEAARRGVTVAEIKKLVLPSYADIPDEG